MCSYKKFQPESTSRKRENIEWTITYHYNATDTVSPRVLLCTANDKSAGYCERKKEVLIKGKRLAALSVTVEGRAEPIGEYLGNSRVSFADLSALDSRARTARLVRNNVLEPLVVATGHKGCLAES